MKTGKLSESMLIRSILKEIKTNRPDVVKGAAVGNDCALFAIPEGAVCASATQEGMLLLESAGDIVQKALNNLATSTAVPMAVSTTLLLPEDTPESEIKEIFREIERVIAPLQVQIIGGQTSVAATVTAPWLIVTAYGIAKNSVMSKPEAGMDIVISKWIGLEGTAILSRHFEDKLLGRYPSFLAERAKQFHQYLSILPEAATAVKSGVCSMHDASKGGIFAALWEIAQGAGVGLKIDMKKLPLRQETVEVCELLEVNPYKLLSGGSLIMITSQGENLVQALQEQGIPACVVGVTTAGKEKILTNEEEVRFLEKPDQDELFRMMSY